MARLVRRRIIKGGYVFEVHFLWERLKREANARLRFHEIYETYCAHCKTKGWRPVEPSVLGAVLRREAQQMRLVYPKGGSNVLWNGLRVRLPEERVEPYLDYLSAMRAPSGEGKPVS